MKRILLLIGLLVAIIALAAPLNAQGEPPLPDPVNWLKYVAIAITAVLVPLLVEALKLAWPMVPQIVKVVAPLVAGSLLATAGSYLTTLLGAPVDFSLLEQFLTGGGVGLAATVGFTVGKAS